MVAGALIQAAHGAVKRKDSFLNAFYRHLVAQHGVKKAIVAVAYKLLTIAYTLVCKRQVYQERGPLRDEQALKRRATHLRHELEQIGYTVSAEPLTTQAASPHCPGLGPASSML